MVLPSNFDNSYPVHSLISISNCRNQLQSGLVYRDMEQTPMSFGEYQDKEQDSGFSGEQFTISKDSFDIVCES